MEIKRNDDAISQLFKLGVEVIPNSRLYGVDDENVFLQHTINSEPIVCEGVDTLVLAMGHESEMGTSRELAGIDAEIISIGDCLAPRTAEEAVLERLEARCAI